MSRSVQIKHTSWVPNTGFNSSGSPENAKTRVVATVVVDSYDATNGESLSALDLGLSTINSIQFRVVDESDYSAGTDQTFVQYEDTGVHGGTGDTGIMGIVSIAGATGVITEIAGTTAVTVQVDALGDSAASPELL